MLASPWNSLEVTKVVAALLTPVFLFVLGYLVTRAGRRVENAQWANRKLIERRLELHKEMAPLANDLLCFFTWRGHFREVDPPEAVTTKRELDKIFFANEQLFSDQLRSRYRDFINSGFEHTGKAGYDARLRTSGAQQKLERGEGKEWKPKWGKLFVDESERCDPGEILHAYEALMESFASDLDVPARNPPRARSA